MKHTILKTLSVAVVMCVVATPSFTAERHAHWTYAGPTGPAKWGDLQKEFTSCKLGKTQSPIDIRDNAVKKADLPAINFDY